MVWRNFALGILALASVSFVGCGPKEEPLAKPGGPMEAHQWRMLAWKNENGNIDPEGMIRARSQIRQLQAASVDRRGPTGTWEERGPWNVAGRSRSLIIHPTNPNLMFHGSVGGGIWKSTDAGATWNQVDDKLANLAICTLAFDPNDSNTIYAGTGEGYFNSDAIAGGGLLRSKDGGNTWSIMASTVGLGDINRVVVAPGNSNLILMATKYGGIRRSTDGGVTWATTKPAQMGAMVVFHPSNANNAVCSVLDYNFTTNQWFYEAAFTTNGGATWTTASGLTQNGFSSRIELAYAPSNPNVVYASHGWDRKVYKSTNGGQSYTLVTTSGTTNTSWYYNHIWVDPTNENFLVLTGLNVFKSTNGGASITKIGDGYILTEQPHDDAHSITPHPGFNGSSNKKVYVMTDGGGYVADDIYTASTTSGWARLTRDVRTTQFYGAAGDGATGRIIGGTQDNGTLRLVNGTNNANMTFGGDGGWSAIDYQDNSYMYGEYVYLQIWRSTNTGNSGSYIYNGISDAGSGNTANFIAPITMDTNDPKILYGGGSSLWRTLNARATNVSWSAVKGSVGSNISAIATAKSDSNVVWVGHNNGQVYKTVNGLAASPSWTTIDNNGGTNPFPNRYVGRIAVAPTNANIVYVGLGGFNGDNLWKTTNGGSTWTDATGAGATGLPSAPIRGIAVDPTDPNIVWVGTEVGLCKSSDGGATWTAPTDGPLNVSIDEVVFMHNNGPLMAVTHGRGIWIQKDVSISTFTGPSRILRNTYGDFTITLNTTAPAGGQPVQLAAGSPAIVVPEQVIIPEGQTSLTFPLLGANVAKAKNTTVTATLNGESKVLNVAVFPMQPEKLTFNRYAVEGGTGETLTGTVLMTFNAPAGGLNVALSTYGSAAGAIQVPASVFVPEGQRTVSFNATHSKVGDRVAVGIQALYDGFQKTNAVNVDPPKPTAAFLTPTNIVGGSGGTWTATFTLSQSAPAGGVTVYLRSNSALATVPGSVVVPAGQTQGTFNITHSDVNSNTKVGFGIRTGSNEFGVSGWLLP